MTVPSIYLDPRHYDVLAELTAPADLPFYERQLATVGGPVLELGCGTGRVCLRLARRGAAVTGLDNSEPMVAHARRKALALGLEAELAVADMRSFDLGRAFPLVLLPYNAFNHLLDLESVRRCFQAVQAHLTPESRFVIDTFQPSLAFLSGDPEKRRRVVEYVDPDGRGRVVMTEQNVYDAASQINRVVWHYEINGQADARVDELCMRMVFPQELDALLELSGFAIEHKYGDYDESPFDSSSSKQLMVCRLREGA